MKTLLERQVEALRESIEPDGKWDRLASGKMEPGEEEAGCPLCAMADKFGTCSSVCPLGMHVRPKGQFGCGNAYHAWGCAVEPDAYEDRESPLFNSHEAVALAREMKALLASLLVEYEAKLAKEKP